MVLVLPAGDAIAISLNGTRAFERWTSERMRRQRVDDAVSAVLRLKPCGPKRENARALERADGRRTG